MQLRVSASSLLEVFAAVVVPPVLAVSTLVTRLIE